MPIGETTMTTLGMVCVITFLAAITPGPNFWKIVHHSIHHSRPRAILFVIGLLTGSTIHCTLGILGLSALLATCQWCLTAIQLLGGTYIAWYGAKLLLGRKTNARQRDSGQEKRSVFKVWGDGVLTNLSNPKSFLFYASLFTMIISPDMPATHIVLHIILLLVTVFLTNCTIAHVLSIPGIRSAFHRFQDTVAKIVGGMLVLAGIKIVLQKRA